LAWRIEIKKTAEKDIACLDRRAQSAIVTFLREKVAQADNPRQIGKALKGEFKDLWRYRVGLYRIICYIQDNIVVVLVLKVRHRKEAYR
jgi:mRNA interferase RelE/StbE